MQTEERELVTAAAIARLAGVGRAAVSNWRKRYPGFPKPAGGSPSSPAFDRAEVMAWLKATGKADQLATAGSTDGGTLGASQPAGDGYFASFDALFRDTWKKVPEQSISSLLPQDLLARSMAALLPRSVAPEAAPADDQELPVVIDPACGSALTLLAVADRFGDRVRLAGQEIQEGAARIAAFNLSGNSRGAPYEVHAGDSLISSQLGQYLGRASAVVCEPPFDRPDWPVAELTTDPRWEFGIPAPRDGELAWVQHCYAHLRPHGVAVIAVSQRACVSLSGEHIRGALVRSGVLCQVVALPRGIGAGGTDICLWVLRRPAGAPERAPVRLADLSDLSDPSEVPLDFSSWEYLLSSGDPALVRAVDRLELLEEAACLLPARYLPPARASASDLNEVTGRLSAVYANVARGLPRYSPAKTPLAGRRVLATLSELERAGALTIRARDDAPRPGDVLLRTQSRPPVVATAITAADDEIGHLVEVPGIAQVIEIDPRRLDSHFVALFLREDVAALPVANTLGAINRDDLRRCRIPRLPLTEQRKYGAAFRQLTELEQALTRLSDLSAKVIEQTIFAITTGSIAPDYQLPAAGAGNNAGQDEAKERCQ